MLRGRDLTEEPFQARRSVLSRVIVPGDRFGLAVQREVASVAALEDAFAQAIEDGCEGLVCKSMKGVYQAGVCKLGTVEEIAEMYRRARRRV